MSIDLILLSVLLGVKRGGGGSKKLPVDIKKNCSRISSSLFSVIPGDPANFMKV